MVQRLCGGLQGIIEHNFEPGVEVYLAMGTQWYKIMRSH